MSKVNKEDFYVKTFMGTDYDLGQPETIGELKKTLEYIINDLPTDNSLEIAQVHAHKNKLEYILVDGIAQ